MNFWRFKFEGVFTVKREDNFKGVFSKCLVPEAKYEKAYSRFLQALGDEDIDLLEVIEPFDYDGLDLDDSDDNLFWKQWYLKARESEEPVFAAWHVFVPEDHA
jgi:hypothetical protein